MLIALIDDGINTELAPDIKVAEDMVVDMEGHIRHRMADEDILTNHGTTCALIISKYAPEATFISLRILGDDLTANVDQLIAAMEYCLVKRFPIVHMSLGTTLLNDYKKIQPLVAKMLGQRQILVAARSNSSSYSIPACLSGVLGVVADRKLVHDAYRVTDGTHHTMIHASAKHSIMLPAGNPTITAYSNSYAAPTVTAIVHELLTQHEPYSLTAMQVYQRLARDGSIYFAKPDFIHDAVIVNPNGVPILKQHLFFVCLEEYKSFKDIKHADRPIRNLVYLRALDDAVNLDLRNSNTGLSGLLYGGICNNEKGEIFVWDESPCQYARDTRDNGRALPPVVQIDLDGLASIDLICQLRDLFFKDGYQCCCLSDYPYSYLYGIEHTSPSVSGQEALSYVNELYRPDIILTCSEACMRMKWNENSYYVILAPCNTRDDQVKNYCYMGANANTVDALKLYKEITRYFS